MQRVNEVEVEASILQGGEAQQRRKIWMREPLTVITTTIHLCALFCAMALPCLVPASAPLRPAPPPACFEIHLLPNMVVVHPESSPAAGQPVSLMMSLPFPSPTLTD